MNGEGRESSLKEFLDQSKLYPEHRARREYADLERRLAEAEEKTLAVVRGEFTQICSYCGFEAPPPNGWTELEDHIKGCEKHPLVKALKERTELLEVLEPLRGATIEQASYLDLITGHDDLSLERRCDDKECRACDIRQKAHGISRKAAAAVAKVKGE